MALPSRPEARPIPADKARQGEILRTTWQRGVFIAGLFGEVLLAIAIWWLA